MGWDVDPTKLALFWIFSCNRSCFIYVVYSKTSCLCNFFFNDEWLWTPKISILFMLLFTSSWQQKLNAYHIYANTEKIKYPVSHIAGWCTWSACRLHNLPNQKVKKKITEAQHLSFLSLSEKKVKVVITPQYSPSLLCYLTVEYNYGASMFKQ